jgi:DNA-binding transcriptional MerR regulator
MNEKKELQEFITIKKATKAYGFSSQLLRKWEAKGLLTSQRTPGNTRLYN